MDLFEELRKLGVNVDEAIRRLNGNQVLYKKLLGSLISAIEDHYVEPGFDCTDYTETTERAHAIKGAAGNLSITPVYEAYTEIVKLLRANQPEQAKEILEKILPVQNEIISCIKKYM